MIVSVLREFKNMKSVMKTLSTLQALTALFTFYKLFNLYLGISGYKFYASGSWSCCLTSPAICILLRGKLDEYTEEKELCFLNTLQIFVASCTSSLTSADVLLAEQTWNMQ